MDSNQQYGQPRRGFLGANLIWIVPLALILIMGLGFMGSYNRINTKDEAVNNAWGDVESTLQRRSDLIPNLVNVVKGYAEHERETLNNVVTARAQATQMRAPDLSDPAAMERFQASQAAVGSALSRLMAIAENYPDLKANQNFLDLQHQLEGTENRINVARTRYNGAVGELNKAIRVIPGKFINDWFLQLKPRVYFKADEGAQTAPKVEF